MGSLTTRPTAGIYMPSSPRLEEWVEIGPVQLSVVRNVLRSPVGLFLTSPAFRKSWSGLLVHFLRGGSFRGHDRVVVCNLVSVQIKPINAESRTSRALCWLSFFRVQICGSKYSKGSNSATLRNVRILIPASFTF